MLDPACLRLGIDAGGTFTDAVLLDAHHRIVATAKSLTTRFDLSLGIAASLDQLPAELRARVGLVCLSTTLTTNSVIEGKGAHVCVLLAGYDAAQIKNSGLVELLGNEAIESLAGGHDAGGCEVQPMDEAAARAAIARHAQRVSAFAISAGFATRNPAHELQLRAWVQELCDKPVTCGHELASSLGAPRRALTAALNARMVSHTKALIESVQKTLAQRGMGAPLMMVKGDGSLVNIASALAQPVGTVLSGPAASVLGACALSGLQNAVIADMGGTTTDIAVVRNGQAMLSVDGAMIGQWRPMVEAVKVYAIGLGGDSEVRFSGGNGLAIGPRRVLPLSLLAHQHPHVLAVLQRQTTQTPHTSQMRFAVRLHADAAQLARLSEDENAAWERLAQGPIDMEEANLNNRGLARALARLERKGLAIYSGFTPSDAAHALGLSQHWSAPAGRDATIIWARQMRHLYGLGSWVLGDAIAPARQVLDKVVETICEKLIEAGLNDANQMHEGQSAKMAALLTQIALHADPSRTNSASSGTGGNSGNSGGSGTGNSGVSGSANTPAVFQLQFAPDLPLVAVGAPAASYYPSVARSLGMTLCMPEHAAVANAVGAVWGQVSQRAHITITQPLRGLFRVFGQQGPRDFSALSEAIALAQEEASAQALRMALHAGALHPSVVLSQWDNQVRNDIDGDVFFEARVTATASGAPMVVMPPEPPGQS
jgi:N-methylhydantoinase A/oxoprolinase/acetone carboxylase beta subunit